MALPFPRSAFDAAIMALVIFFVPNPAKGVAEMTRVVRPGGMYERELFAHDRFLCQIDIGGLPYTKVARSIELLATVVLPAIGRA